MAVKPRGSSWQATVYGPSNARYRRQFETEIRAKEWELESKMRLLKGEEPDLGPVKGSEGAADGQVRTLRQLLDRVYEIVWSKHKAGEKSRLNALTVITMIGPSLPIEKVSLMHIDSATETLRKQGNAPGTINRKLAAFSRLLSFAVTRGLITTRPTWGRLRENSGRTRRFTTAEETKVLAYFLHMGNQDMHDVVVLALDQGLRRSEAASVEWSEIDDTHVLVPAHKSKSGKARKVPLRARSKAVMARRRAVSGYAEGPVFPALTVWSLTHYWGKVRDALDMLDDREFVFHILRHEFCSRLADKGFTAPMIQRLAGHSSITVSQRYIHMDEDILTRAISNLDEPQGDNVSLDRYVAVADHNAPPHSHPSVQ